MEYNQSKLKTLAKFGVKTKIGAVSFSIIRERITLRKLFRHDNPSDPCEVSRMELLSWTTPL